MLTSLFFFIGLCLINHTGGSNNMNVTIDTMEDVNNTWNVYIPPSSGYVNQYHNLSLGCVNNQLKCCYTSGCAEMGHYSYIYRNFPVMQGHSRYCISLYTLTNKLDEAYKCEEFLRISYQCTPYTSGASGWTTLRILKGGNTNLGSVILDIPCNTNTQTIAIKLHAISNNGYNIYIDQVSVKWGDYCLDQSNYIPNKLLSYNYSTSINTIDWDDMSCVDFTDNNWILSNVYGLQTLSPSLCYENGYIFCIGFRAHYSFTYNSYALKQFKNSVLYSGPYILSLYMYSGSNFDYNEYLRISYNCDGSTLNFNKIAKIYHMVAENFKIKRNYVIGLICPPFSEINIKINYYGTTNAIIYYDNIALLNNYNSSIFAPTEVYTDVISTGMPYTTTKFGQGKGTTGKENVFHHYLIGPIIAIIVVGFLIWKHYCRSSNNNDIKSENDFENNVAMTQFNNVPATTPTDNIQSNDDVKSEGN